MGKTASPGPKKASRKPSSSRAPSESQTVEALTVGWVLSIVITLLFDLTMVGTRWYVHQINPDAQWVLALHFVAFLGGLVAAIVCLVLAFFTVRLRTEKPPINVTRFAVVVSCVPFVVAAFNYFTSG